MSKVAIIKSIGSNFASISSALTRLNQEFIVTDDAKIIEAATHVILPGVGNAAHAMEQLHANNLIGVIKKLTQPVLGICLGMQLLFDSLEEGEVAGLGIIKGRVKKVKTELPLPHMGWNSLTKCANDPLLAQIKPQSDFYFVHSFAAEISADSTIACCSYGEEFAAVVHKNNFYGVQFHPEKSGMSGEQLLRNFLAL